MAGNNQHYIPRFLLRAFEIPESERRIWRFWRGERRPVKPNAIKSTASEAHFFSTPNAEKTLDDAISSRESSDLSKRFNALLSMRPGDSVRAMDAAALVAHLTQRTRHVQSTLHEGATGILEKFQQAFDRGDGVESVMGLDGTEPTEKFRELLRSRPELAASLRSLPQRTRERMMYLRAKEQARVSARMMGAALGGYQPELASLVRDSHRSALLSQVVEDSDYEAALRTFDWTIEHGPTGGAILPDCVGIAFGADGQAGNHMLIGVGNMKALIVAVSPDLLLVGRRVGCALPEELDYNMEAACLSHTFFVAPRNDDETARLHAMVGIKLRPSLEGLVETSLKEALTESSGGKTQSTTEAPLPWVRSQRTIPHCELIVTAYGDKGTNDDVRKVLRDIVERLARVWSLERLDGVTVGSDYARALQSVDLGGRQMPVPNTVSPELGTGIAQTLWVMRSGRVKGHIVLSRVVLDALLSMDGDLASHATHVITHQLAAVELIELYERSFPGNLLKPYSTNSLDCWLHDIARGAVGSYMASWMVVGVGGAEQVATRYSEQLVVAVDRLMNAVVESRLAYQRHGNLARLLGVVMPTIERVLNCAADLLGHWEGAGGTSIGATDSLDEMLSRAGLANWLRVYGEDLARFHGRLLQGESLDFREVLAFNIHTERLLWLVGLFPHEVAGTVRVEVPPVSRIYEWMRALGEL